MDTHAEFVAGDGDEDTEKSSARKRNSRDFLPPVFSAELTVVVIGSTETVTYGPGNILLGGEKMLQETEQLSQAAAVRKREVAGRCISVVDMVGVLDSDLPQEEAEKWVQHCVYGCEQGIHAFLLAVPLGGLTDQERRGAEWIQRAFGERALGFTVVLLIYDDEEKKELELMKNRDVQRLVEECGGRYQTCCRSISSQAEVSELLEKIDSMLFGNTDRCYTKGMHQEAGLEVQIQQIQRSWLTELVDRLKIMLRQLWERIKAVMNIRKKQEGCGVVSGSRDGLRMVLIGRTGVGKSATGNSILGREAFVSEARDTAVTKVCWRASGEVAGKPITVLDTPGLFGTALSNEEVRKEIGKCMGMLAPGPHAILLVLQLGQFTKNDENIFKMIREIFGAGSEKYTFILFSHRDCLRNETVEDYIQRGDTGLKLLLKQCGGRYHSFSNTEMGSRSQVTEFVEKIEKMVESNGGDHFSSELYQDTALRAELRLEEREMEIQRLREKVERQREVMEKRESELQKGNEYLLKLKEEVKQKEERIRESEEKATRRKEEIQNLLGEIKSMRDKQRELQEVLVRLEEEKQEREEEVLREREQLQREREEVKREREEIRKRAEMLERKTEEIEQIEEITKVQKEELEKQREDIRRQMQTFEEERNDLHEREEKIQRKVEDTERKLKEINKQRDEIKTKEEEMAKIMDEIQRKNEMVKTGKEAVQTLMEDIRNGKTVTDSEMGEVKKLEEGLKAKEVEFERERVEFQKREDEVKTYKEVIVRELLTKIKERKSNVGIEESQEKEVEIMLTYRGHEEEMKKREVQMEKERKELQWQMENRKREAEMTREIKEEMQRLTEEITEKEREIQSYKEEVQRLGEEFEKKERKKQKEIEKKEGEIQSYRDKVQREEFTEKERELERYEHEVQKLEYDINNKEGELKTSKEAMQKLGAEIKLKEEDLKKKEGEMQGCEEEMQRLKNELIKKERENEKEMEKKEREIQMYKEEIQRLGAEMKRREEEKEREMEKRRMMEEEAQKLKEEITEKEKLIQQLQEQIHSMSAVSGVTPAPGFSELRIVLLGVSGVGKSATGNTILGREEFESRPSLKLVTQQCQRARGEVDGRSVSIIDTPGFFSPDQDIIGEVKRCIPLSAPGPHVFLHVFQVGGFIFKWRQTVEMIQNTFGEDARKYSMVLFTRGDDLGHISIADYLKLIPELQELVSRCHGGYHVFNNRNMADRAQVTELLEKIDRMVERNGGGHYTNEMLQEAERADPERRRRTLWELLEMFREEK